MKAFNWLFLIITLVFVTGLTLAIISKSSASSSSSASPVRVAIVSMVTRQPDFDVWLQHHLQTIGVDRIYLRIENAPTIADLAQRYPREVYYEQANDNDAIKPNNYHTQMDRQGDWVNRMIRKARDEHIDYLFHIDSDELISLSDPLNLRKYLQTAPGDAACIHFKNYEAVYQPASDLRGCFDAAHFLDCSRDSCTSYANGKSAAVIANCAEDAYHGPHYFQGKVYEMPDELIHIRHFDSCTFEAWREKFQRMTQSDPDKIPFPFYKQSIELHQRQASEQEMRAFYRARKERS
jgi:hypothetical protein